MVRNVRLISKFIKLQPRKQIIVAIYVLPNISRSKDNQAFIYLFSLYLMLTKYRKQKIHAYNIKTYNEVFLAYQRYAN